MEAVKEIETNRGTQGLSLRERHRQEREEVILDTALVMIRDNGYAAMTMDDLAAQAQISKPTLYAHFSSKEEIAIRAIVRVMGEGITYLENQDPSLPAFSRLESYFKRSLTTKFIERCSYLGTARDVLGTTIRAHPEYRVLYGRMVELLSRLIEEGKADGTIKPHLSTRIAVQSAISIMRDAEYADLLSRDECTPEELIETLTSILMDGMRVRLSDVAAEKR